MYAYFGAAGAVCYSHAGDRKWRASLGTNAKNQPYGSAASPVLSGDLLIVNACIETAELYQQGDTVALNKRTGKEVWRQKAGGEWSSPLLVSVGGKIEFELLAHNTIEDDKSVFNGSPAVCGSYLFLRSDKYLYCIGKR